MPSTRSTSDSFGVQAVRPLIVESAGSANRAGSGTGRRRERCGHDAGGSRRPAPASPGRSRSPRAITASQSSSAGPIFSTASAPLTASSSGQSGSRSILHDLLLRRVHAAGENPRLDRRAIAARANHERAIDAAMETPSSRGPPDRRRPGPPDGRGRRGAATLFAALPAPPATISVASYLRISTGASRETRATSP